LVIPGRSPTWQSHPAVTPRHLRIRRRRLCPLRPRACRVGGRADPSNRMGVRCRCPPFVLARFGVRDFVRPELVAPVTTTANPNGSPPSTIWFLHAGFVPLGRSTPAPGQTWSSIEQVIQNCQGISGGQKALHSTSYCERVNHLRYVMQFQPPSHFWALQAAESAIFLGIAAVLVGLTVLTVRRWGT
jgi:hypothetical protein